MRGKLAERGSWFRAIAAADHRKLEWRAVLDFPNAALACEARGADLVVIGRTAIPRDSYSTLDPGGAMLKIGRPALVVPDGIGALRADHVVIGWKDTREARRAVVDALPFLREASRVTVVEICESGEESAAQERIDEVAHYLSRHRIGDGPRVVIHQEGSGAAQLIRLAQDEGADLIVADAYGHSRLGEYRFASDLIGISAAILPPYPAESGYFVTGEAVERERRDIEAALARAEMTFRGIAGVDRKGLEWRSGIELPGFYVASQARAADLLIIGRQAGDIARSLDSGGVVLRAGRPVLVAPPNVDTLSEQRVIVGWKDTREARRALRDALPFLQRAEAVTIAEVIDEGPEVDAGRRAGDVVRYLARHKVQVGATIAAHPKSGVADELIRIAKAEGADLIVAGAYGHSRLGEWMFGGVTRDLLASSPVCCLLAH
jgi:nucleotide-binding universal stress UspA family protein